MENKPIETRTLKPPTSSTSTGSIKLWVDIENTTGLKKKNVRPPWDISPLPEQTLELRVIIWETTKVPNDDPEDMSDIYVKACLPNFNNITQQTDTHARASNGFVISD